jgi:hypothetical protein
LVWGDGVKTDRVIVSATGLPPHGAHLALPEEVPRRSSRCQCFDS